MIARIKTRSRNPVARAFDAIREHDWLFALVLVVAGLSTIGLLQFLLDAFHVGMR